MRKIIYALFVFVSPVAQGQVHEVTITDTARVRVQMLEDSAIYFSFSNKKLSGHWIAYYDEQKQHKAIEATFKKGKLIGSQKQWYEDGKILSEKKCENDTCTTDYFYPDGALMKRDIEVVDAVTYKGNRFYSASYCNNGQIKYSPPLNPDSRSAQFITSYYCSGFKKEEFTLVPVAGTHLRIGPYTEWFENGALKMNGYYGDENTNVAGKKIGFWNYYNADGKLTLQEKYENGELMEKMEY